jgi:hypothetical protein
MEALEIDMHTECTFLFSSALTHFAYPKDADTLRLVPRRAVNRFNLPSKLDFLSQIFWIIA